MALLEPLFDPPVSLIPFDDSHIEPLRAACAEDVDIWDIYPLCMIGEHFYGSIALLSMLPNWYRFAVMDDGALVGMTSYIGTYAHPGSIEIGATYIAPAVRGSNFNFKMKALLIEHAFANAFHTVEFKVDTRNGRSMRAVEKLGARRTATLVRNMTTWTGYVRDTAVFQLTKADWESHLSH